MVRHDPW